MTFVGVAQAPPLKGVLGKPYLSPSADSCRSTPGKEAPDVSRVMDPLLHLLAWAQGLKRCSHLVQDFGQAF